MKYKVIVIILFFSNSLRAQNDLSRSKTERYLFEPHFGYLFAVGKVDIQGTNTPWINTLYPDHPEDQINERDHDGNYLNLGATISRTLSPKIQLGIGVDMDFYLGIGDYTRYCLPISVNVKYKVTGDKNSFFLYAEPGFAPNIGGDFYGGVKAAAGLGYVIKSAKTGHQYSLTVGYSFQQLKNLQQFVLTTIPDGGSANYLTSVNYHNVVVHTLPIRFGYAF